MLVYSTIFILIISLIVQLTLLLKCYATNSGRFVPTFREIARPTSVTASKLPNFYTITHCNPYSQEAVFYHEKLSSAFRRFLCVCKKRNIIISVQKNGEGGSRNQLEDSLLL